MVLLLHYVREDFPELRCRTRVNVTSGAASDLLRHHCERVDAAGAAASVAAAPGAAAPARSGAGPEERYLLYNPCTTNLDPSYCQSQFNNQVVFLLHALCVSKALGRTLVLPPFMWMEHQMADEQHWFPFDHFFDLARLENSNMAP